MFNRYSEESLFSNGDLHEALMNNVESLRNEVDHLPADHPALHRDELYVGLLSKWGANLLRLDETAISEEDVVRKDHFGDAVRLAGTRVTVSVPFSGDTDLWHLCPREFGLTRPRGMVNRSTLVISNLFEGVPTSQNAANWYSQIMQTIR